MKPTELSIALDVQNYLWYFYSYIAHNDDETNKDACPHYNANQRYVNPKAMPLEIPHSISQPLLGNPRQSWSPRSANLYSIHGTHPEKQVIQVRFVDEFCQLMLASYEFTDPTKLNLTKIPDCATQPNPFKLSNPKGIMEWNTKTSSWLALRDADRWCAFQGQVLSVVTCAAQAFLTHHYFVKPHIDVLEFSSTYYDKKSLLENYQQKRLEELDDNRYEAA